MIRRSSATVDLQSRNRRIWTEEGPLRSDIDGSAAEQRRALASRRRVVVLALFIGSALGWAGRSLSSTSFESDDRSSVAKAQETSAEWSGLTDVRPASRRVRQPSQSVDGAEFDAPGSTNSSASVPAPGPEEALLARCRHVASLVGAARGRAAGELAADARTDPSLRNELWRLMLVSNDADVLAAVSDAAQRNAFIPISEPELDELFGKLTEGDPGDRASALTWAWAMGQLSIRTEGYEEGFRRLLVAPLRDDARTALLFGVHEASLAERPEVRDALLVAFRSTPEPGERRKILGAMASGLRPAEKSEFFLELWKSSPGAVQDDVAAAYIDSAGTRGRRNAAGAPELSVAGQGTPEHAGFLQLYAQTRDAEVRTRFAVRCRQALGLTTADWASTLLDLARAETDVGLRERLSTTAAAIESGEIRDTVTAGARIARVQDE